MILFSQPECLIIITTLPPPSVSQSVRPGSAIELREFSRATLVQLEWRLEITGIIGNVKLMLKMA